jgi:hypothetical protein
MDENEKTKSPFAHGSAGFPPFRQFIRVVKHLAGAKKFERPDY